MVIIIKQLLLSCMVILVLADPACCFHPPPIPSSPSTTTNKIQNPPNKHHQQQPPQLGLLLRPIMTSRSGKATTRSISSISPSTCSRLCHKTGLKGCDTFIAYPPTTPEGMVIFGKNSDRPAGEGQSITKYPACQYYENKDNNQETIMVHCTYIQIPQVSSTYAIILSQIDWMWGAEMGSNECGVVIGNEAVWTNVSEDVTPKLLGMDLVRLGLERGSTAMDAKNVMIALLEEHGQGGPCAENDPSFTYHNSFLIADCNETWILETAGTYWAAQRIQRGGRNISNGLTIRTEFDECSHGLQEYAKQEGLWNGKDPFDFAKAFSAGGPDEDLSSRQGCGTAMLNRHDQKGTFSDKDMIEILRDHKSGICMHGGFETTASMVSVLYQPSKGEGGKGGPAQHWMTGQPFPCQSKFLLQEFPTK